MLTIRNFSKSYDDIIIVSIPELVLSPGIHWFKGQNGSGKSTLFKSLSGIVPSAGVVAFDDGITLHGQPITYRQRVNFSEAEPIYPAFLTPLEMMRFVGMAKGSTIEHQNQLFQKFGVSVFQHKPFGACSSGMVKKVSLALAFTGKPRLVILDEPLITLDDKSRSILTEIITDYVVRENAICLLSSHQQLEGTELLVSGRYVIQDNTVSLI